MPYADTGHRRRSGDGTVLAPHKLTGGIAGQFDHLTVPEQVIPMLRRFLDVYVQPHEG
jgi:hypothetical protein